jgi:hypothetical protein
MVIFFHTPAAAKPKEANMKEKIIQMDLPGTALVMGAIISFILAMEKGGQTESWKSSVVIGLIIGSALMWIAFVALEWYMGDTGMIPPRIYRQRSVWVGAWFQFCFGGAYFIVLYYLPIYFQSVYNTSAINSGVRMLAMIVPMTFAIVIR